MENLIDYRKLIAQLNQEKWDILLKEGEEVAKRKWPKIDAKIKRLEAWDTVHFKKFFKIDTFEKVTLLKSVRVIKNEILE
jgi:hypothetical protein